MLGEGRGLGVGQRCYWHLMGRNQDRAKHPTIHRIAPHNELSSSKCHGFWVEKAYYPISLIKETDAEIVTSPGSHRS